MLEDLPRLRGLHGRTTVVWGGDDVRHEPGRWVALSGAQGVDFNVALLHERSGGTAIPQTLGEIAAARAPAIVMVAGAALAEVQQLVEASWVCVGACAFMGLELREETAPVTGARRLAREEMPRVHELVDEVFGIGPELAGVAVPERTVDAPGRAVWGRFAPDGTLVCAAATMVVEDVVAAWSVASSPRHRRQGHAAELLRGALAAAWADGARRCVLNSSTDGEPFYRRLGFVELERWQLWSRRRWVMGPG